MPRILGSEVPDKPTDLEQELAFYRCFRYGIRGQEKLLADIGKGWELTCIHCDGNLEGEPIKGFAFYRGSFLGTVTREIAPALLITKVFYYPYKDSSSHAVKSMTHDVDSHRCRHWSFDLWFDYLHLNMDSIEDKEIRKSVVIREF